MPLVRVRCCFRCVPGPADTAKCRRVCGGECDALTADTPAVQTFTVPLNVLALSEPLVYRRPTQPVTGRPWRPHR